MWGFGDEKLWESTKRPFQTQLGFRENPAEKWLKPSPTWFRQKQGSRYPTKSASEVS
jgi:hypothetical protein